jgi:hypothetical protein
LTNENYFIPNPETGQASNEFSQLDDETQFEFGGCSQEEISNLVDQVRRQTTPMLERRLATPTLEVRLSTPTPTLDRRTELCAKTAETLWSSTQVLVSLL